MKKTTILIMLTCMLNRINAQNSVYYFTNFEDDWSFIEFDPPEGNIWQVGTPSKKLLDSAYSAPYALMTDTANMLYEPGKYSFILKAERPWWGNCLMYWEVGFNQKYNFDSLYSGGYVEVSYDHGLTWVNVIFDDFTGTNAGLTRMYTENDTILNGEPACILNYSTYGQYVSSFGHLLAYPDIVDIYSVWIKFTYINLGTDNPHEGWMIDDLSFEAKIWAEFLNVKEINTNNQINIFPNPANSTITLKIDEEDIDQWKCEIFNLHGKLLDVLENINSNIFEINISNYSKGNYIYRVSDKMSIIKTGKFILE